MNCKYWLEDADWQGNYEFCRLTNRHCVCSGQTDQCNHSQYNQEADKELDEMERVFGDEN